MKEGIKSEPKRAERLRLRALDPGDLQVIAACLQDALIPLREMAFMADQRRFLASFHRFQWEALLGSERSGDLTCCQSVLRIDHVDSVQYRGLDGELSGVKFELLTIMSEPRDEGGFQMTLIFAGDVALRLQVSELAVALEHFGDTWPAASAPCHDMSNDSASGS